MENPQAAFLADAPRRINNLREDINRLRRADGEQSELVRQIFRALHTLKGSAAAFNFPQVSRLAHELESVWEALDEENFAASVAVLDEGLSEIESAFADKQSFNQSENKFSRWREVYKSAPKQASENDNFVLPFDLEKQLSADEIKRLHQSLKQNFLLAVISAEFPAAQFSAEFSALQAKLKNAGEIVAVLPDAEKTRNGKIALRLIYVCREKSENLKALLTNANAEIAKFFEVSERKNFPNETAKIKLSNLWLQARLAAEKTVAAQGKRVRFEADGEETEIEKERAEACEIALLHIARNAVAHGIEAPATRRANGKTETGLIKFAARRDKDSLCLKISDDGRGVDLNKIREAAKRRGLIEKDSDLDDEKALRFVFRAGFSTFDDVTEDAGRGVGLDAVETAVRETGGTVEISSELDRGTVFLIRFPRKN